MSDPILKLSLDWAHNKKCFIIEFKRIAIMKNKVVGNNKSFGELNSKKINRGFKYWEL